MLIRRIKWPAPWVGGRAASVAVLLGTAMLVSACGGGGTAAGPPSLSEASSAGDAAGSNITMVGQRPGVTPFIQLLYYEGSSLAQLAGVTFTIVPKPGSVSKPVNVWYSVAALTERAYLSSQQSNFANQSSLTLPVFGLYAGYANQVAVEFQFQDGTTQSLPVTVTTASYVDPSEIYATPTIVQPRAAGSALGFDFFYMKSAIGSPVVVDTDAEVRWVVPGIANATSTLFQNGEFVIGDPALPIVYRLLLDGTQTQSPLGSGTYIEFHHNIDPGNRGLFAEVNAETDGVENVEATVIEMTDVGAILDTWNLAEILSAYMQSQGDDASAFVRPGVDWFHNNSSTYDASDNSIIVSSRENFVIKLDYQTGQIIWILGDPTKYWYTFPSLRAKALTLAPGGLYPIGQHALSIMSDGSLMLFNDGLGSQNEPTGAPGGQNRTYSAVSDYSIDAASMTATNNWNFDYGQSIYSSICSSAYEASSQSILVDYAVADNGTEARLVGLDSSHTVVFDFQYATGSCDSSWNAVPIAFDNLQID
jgi:arylsulfate sulfotransferase